MSQMRRSNLTNTILALCIALGVCLLDFVTKRAIMANFEVGDTKDIVSGVLNFTYIRNKGAMMGILSDHRWVFMILSTVLLIGIVWFLIKDKNTSKITVATLGMILGGGIGNMIDRVFYGEVVDFIDVRFIPFWKWIFNVADIFVTCGAILLAISFIFFEIKKSKVVSNDNKEI